MANPTYQKDLFDAIKHKQGKSPQVLAELSSILNIAKGALYKRMNGDTNLSATELITLAKHYDLSLDSIYRKEDLYTFAAPFTDTLHSDESGFLLQFNELLAPLKNQKAEIKLIYMANELPIFYYFKHKYIFNFLMSVWKHLHWSEDRLLVSREDSYDVMRTSFAKRFTEQYYVQQVTEIWNSNMLNNLYQQIIFCITIRSFAEQAYVDRLIEDIQMLIDHLKQITQGQMTLSNQSFQIYLNDFGNYLNLVLYQSIYTQSSFVGFDYPHFIHSESPAFYQYAQDWVCKIKGRSILISGEGYQQKELFFMKIERDFEYFKDRVHKLIQLYYH